MVGTVERFWTFFTKFLPPLGMITSINLFMSVNKKSTTFLFLTFINWIKFSSTLFFCNDFLNKFERIRFEKKASEPPFNITEFPDLKQREAISEVTLGRLSYITPITPIGIEILEIFRPFGLFHFSNIILVGSFNFIILFI